MNSNEMTLDTRDFGQVQVSPENIIDFPNGIYAFEDHKQYVLLSPLGEENCPMWLQSAKEKNPCFIVFNPQDVISGYNPVLDEDTKAVIQYEEGDILEYYSIAVIPEDYKKTTINLKSPIVVNCSKRKAVQAILEDDYLIRYPLYSDSSKGGDE